MSDKITIIPKILTKEYLTKNSSIVFKNRELIIEKDFDGIDEHTVYRFKIGDGISSYQNLKYVSNIYSLLPEFSLCNKDYSSELVINFSNVEE